MQHTYTIQQELKAGINSYLSYRYTAVHIILFIVKPRGLIKWAFKLIISFVNAIYFQGKGRSFTCEKFVKASKTPPTTSEL